MTDADIDVELSTRIYLSGKYAHWPQMSLYMRELEQELRCVVTHDWTIEKSRALNARAAARHDIDGVCSCDVLVVVLDDATHPYRGTFCELGAALALKKPVLMCNLLGDGGDSDLMKCVFVKHDSVFASVTSWEEAKRALSAHIEEKKQQNGS